MSDEIRAHVANFSAIDSSMEDLSRGLIYVREFAQALPSDTRASRLQDLSSKALGLLAQIRSDLHYFGSGSSLSETSEDLAMVQENLQEKRPHLDVEKKLDSATTQVLPLCGAVATSLEYLVEFYKLDLQSFVPSPHETWYQNIEKATNRRISDAQAAIETLQDIIRN